MSFATGYKNRKKKDPVPPNDRTGIIVSLFFDLDLGIAVLLYGFDTVLGIGLDV